MKYLNNSKKARTAMATHINTMASAELMLRGYERQSSLWYLWKLDDVQAAKSLLVDHGIVLPGYGDSVDALDDTIYSYQVSRDIQKDIESLAFDHIKWCEPEDAKRTFRQALKTMTANAAAKHTECEHTQIIG